MPEPQRTVRLHRDVYLPLLLAAKAADVPVEMVIWIALDHFGGLPVSERTRIMYAHHFSPGYSTGKAKKCKRSARWLDGVKRALQQLRKLLRRGAAS